MKITGADQGTFKSESKRAGDKGSLCVGFKLRADAASDQRRGTVQVAPLAVTKVWGPSSPQIMTALWQGELLKEVILEFVRQNEAGEEATFETLSLKNASIAYIERRVGKVEAMADGVHRELEEIGFRFESMEAKHHGADGNTVAKYDWRHREGK